MKYDLPDAIQVFVRGFHDIQLGSILALELETIGFQIEMKSHSADYGGIIETNIVMGDTLEVYTVAELRERVYTVAKDCPTVFIQIRKFKVEWETPVENVPNVIPFEENDE